MSACRAPSSAPQSRASARSLIRTTGPIGSYSEINVASPQSPRSAISTRISPTLSGRFLASTPVPLARRWAASANLHRWTTRLHDSRRSPPRGSAAVEANALALEGGSAGWVVSPVSPARSGGDSAPEAGTRRVVVDGGRDSDAGRAGPGARHVGAGPTLAASGSLRAPARVERVRAYLGRNLRLHGDRYGLRTARECGPERRVRLYVPQAVERDGPRSQGSQCRRHARLERRRHRRRPPRFRLSRPLYEDAFSARSPRNDDPRLIDRSAELCRYPRSRARHGRPLVAGRRTDHRRYPHRSRNAGADHVRHR